MTISTPPNLIGLKLGNYRLERMLGRGRMGVVYVARDEALLRPTAVKILAWNLPEAHGYDPEAWFLAEARNIARINHPSVIQVYSVARHGAYCYIAMEYVEGVSADKIVDQSGPFDVIRATEIVLQVAGALQAAHACEVIHRDVKPANILIKADGTTKLGDFGMALSRYVQHSGGTGERAGTPQYTAPEIWQLGPASPSTDLYALGATYYYLLTGRPPFEAKDLTGMIAAHLRAPIPDPRRLVPDLPDGCVEIMRQGLAKSPQDRFESAQAFGWKVRGLLRSLDGTNSGLRRRESNRPEVTPNDGGARIREACRQFFGFVREPFSPDTVDEHLDILEPFATAGRQLKSFLLNHAGTTVLLTGTPGSGRRGLVRGILAAPTWSGPVGRVVVDGNSDTGSLTQRACRAFGAVSSPYAAVSGEIEGVLDYLESIRSTNPVTPTLVIEVSAPTQTTATELPALARAAWTTKYLNLVIVGTSDFAAEILHGGLAACVPEALESIALPPLMLRQMMDYLQFSLERARARDAPPVFLTPDAILLVAHRSGGNLMKACRIANNMLLLAYLGRSRVISSWEAWTAPDADCDSIARLWHEGAKPTRAADWPPADVLKLLNATRSEAGLPTRQGSVSNGEGVE